MNILNKIDRQHYTISLFLYFLYFLYFSDDISFLLSIWMHHNDRIE